MYWAVASTDGDMAYLFPSYPLALAELNKFRAHLLRDRVYMDSWHLYSLHDATPPVNVLDVAYEAER